MTVERAAEFALLFESTIPADLTRQITAIHTQFIKLAKDKAEAITAINSRAS